MAVEEGIPTLFSRLGTLRELIIEIMVHHVSLYNERAEGSQIISFLSEEGIHDNGAQG